MQTYSHIHTRTHTHTTHTYTQFQVKLAHASIPSSMPVATTTDSSVTDIDQALNSLQVSGRPSEDLYRGEGRTSEDTELGLGRVGLVNRTS